MRRHGARALGFTLLEVLVSLVILSGAIAGLAVVAQGYSDSAQRALVAQQVRTLGDAAKAYIRDNYAAVQAVATPTAPALIDVATLLTAGNLTPGFSVTNGFNQSMCVLVLEPTANRLQAIVVAEGGSSLNDLDLGDMAAVIGGSGGGVYSTDATTIKGVLGGWQIPVATFDNLVNNVNRRCDGTSGRVRIASGRPAMALWFENGDTSAAFLARDTVPGRPELNQLNTPIVLNSVQTAGGSCLLLGAVARDSAGAVLSCQGGIWKAQGSTYWQDPVATFSALPTCNAASSSQTRVVGTPAVGAGPRAYTCNGSSWQPLAVNDSGNLTVAGTTTTGKMALSDTVVAGTACSPNGLVSKDSNGLILSCQSGYWGSGGVQTESGAVSIYATTANKINSVSYSTLSRGVFLITYYNCIAPAEMSQSYYLQASAEAVSGSIQTGFWNKSGADLTDFSAGYFVLKVLSPTASVNFFIQMPAGGTVTHGRACTTFFWSRLS